MNTEQVAISQRSAAGKSRMERIRNDTVRHIVEVDNMVVEVIQQKV